MVVPLVHAELKACWRNDRLRRDGNIPPSSTFPDKRPDQIRLDRNAITNFKNLPNEIVANIAGILMREHRLCVFDLFIPEWELCDERTEDRLDEALPDEPIHREVVWDFYIRSHEGGLTKVFNHADHVCCYLDRPCSPPTRNNTPKPAPLERVF